MSRNKFKNRPFWAQQQQRKQAVEPRKIDQIQEDYGKLLVQVGDLEYKCKLIAVEKEEAFQKLKFLNEEAGKAKAYWDSKTPAPAPEVVAPTPEGVSGQQSV